MLIKQRSVPYPGLVSQIQSVLADYLTLTKPMIITLLLVTALGGMFLAEQGIPSGTLVLWVLMGGALVSGGANALNHYIERESDQKMTRTRHRPVASHRINPWHALAFGVLLNILGFAVLVAWVNLLSAALTVGATLFYILIYTVWLKKSTTQNIVIGGAAGAVPPLVGWAAVTGSLDLPAFYLFAIVFFWTPPHFWALALLIQKDYARANIPMLPVVKGVKETTWNIFLYSVLLVALTLVFFTTQAVEWVYLASAGGLGAILIYMTWKLWRNEGAASARGVYLYSLLYLAGLFVAVMVDSTVSL
ncbi:MAG: protoheme IX farnesyltransferase [Chloroflexi bacterium]|nr:protoheme IX farnesyltransferase [Chloroflexota bacterium]